MKPNSLDIVFNQLLDRLPQYRDELELIERDTANSYRNTLAEFVDNLEHLAAALGHNIGQSVAEIKSLLTSAEHPALAKAEQDYSLLLSNLKHKTTQQHMTSDYYDLLSMLRCPTQSKRRFAYKQFEQLLQHNSALLADYANAYFALRSENHGNTSNYKSKSCDANGVSSDAWQALLTLVGKNRERVQQSIIGIPVEDFYYFPGTPQRFSPEKALELLKVALAPLDSEIAPFIDLMTSSQRVILSGQAAKGQAACLNFLPDNLPVVLLDFGGTLSDIMVLAHEFGHAYHYYCLLEKGKGKVTLPRCLIEFASILFEQQVLDYLAGVPALSEAARFVARRDGAYYLLEFMARCDLELALHGALYPLTLDTFKQLTSTCYSFWFGNKYREQWAWITRPHFYMHKHPMNHLAYLIGFLTTQALRSHQATNSSLNTQLCAMANSNLESWLRSETPFISASEFFDCGITSYLSENRLI
jgi:oligoendopeptidase F